MISFDGFTTVEGIPIYQQIVLFIERGCLAGTIRNGDELPSRRYLSALLGINPMTVQKAFGILEQQKLIISSTGSRSTVSFTDERIRQLREELLVQDIRMAVSALKQAGLTKDEAVELIGRYWEED